MRAFALRRGLAEVLTEAEPSRVSGGAPRQFDQFGNRLSPLFVICRTFSPVRSTVKIWYLPERDDANARCLPFGENAGLSLLPSPLVID